MPQRVVDSVYSDRIKGEAAAESSTEWRARLSLFGFFETIPSAMLCDRSKMPSGCDLNAITDGAAKALGLGAPSMCAIGQMLRTEQGSASQAQIALPKQTDFGMGARSKVRASNLWVMASSLWGTSTVFGSVVLCLGLFALALLRRTAQGNGV